MNTFQKIVSFIKEGGYYLLLMFITLAVVLASFSAAIGVENTMQAFASGVMNFGKIASVEDENVSELKSAITGTGDEEYKNINLTGYSVKPVNITTSNSAPLLIPTNGIAANQKFLYDPVIHPGVDIWTNVNGKGSYTASKGNEVYSACTGVVSHIFYPNQEIEITCEKLPDFYKDTVPSLNIKILYSHMGDGATKEQYHNLHVGQKLQKGEFVGYQGNISSFVPENRVVHLHFGVYDLRTRKPIDPSSYIGISATTLGIVFKAGVVD
jgi:hypothetical protein